MQILSTLVQDLGARVSDSADLMELLGSRVSDIADLVEILMHGTAAVNHQCSRLLYIFSILLAYFLATDGSCFES